VLAAAAGMSWDEFMKTRVLGPLEMTSATTSVLELWDAADIAPCYECELPGRGVGYERAKIPNIAMPHVPTDSGPVRIPWRTVDNIAPAGSINANVVDVAKWVRMHLAKGVYRGRRILSAAAVSELHSPQMLMPGPPPFPSGHFYAYGLGWYLTDYRGRKLVLHGGAITGWNSTIAFMPEENVGVVVLSNLQLTERWNRLPSALASVVFDRYLGGPARDWSAEWRAAGRANLERLRAAHRELASRRVSGTRPSRSAGELAGTYVNAAFGELVVGERAGSIGLRLAGVLAGDLEHWHYDLFRLRWHGPHQIRAFVRFEVDTAGRVAALDVEGLGTFARQACAASP